ncbi:MAG: DUF2807 domain-containing protein [Chitinophagales bacterium]|nr:DUF2807 domain-containing protein [Chitinophagales bacterium]
MTFKNFLIFFTLSTALLLASSCNKDDDNAPDTGCIKGEGTITTTTLSVADFTGVDLAFSSNVIVNQGSPQKVEATGHPNIIELIKTGVSDNIWTIALENGCYEDYELSVEITVPNINYLGLSGSGNLSINDFTDIAKLEASLNGSGNVDINNFNGTTEFDISLSGNGDFTANKNITLETLNLTNLGSGNFSGFEISTDNCTVNSAGSGDCEVFVQSALDVTISGSGNVSYKGMPTITQEITGSGQLIDAN